MLLTTEWAERVGINPSLVGADRTRAQGIGVLVTWRFLPVSVRNSWGKLIFDKAGKSYPFGSDAAFWRELESKRAGMYGTGSGTAVDPIRAYEHPWCLSNSEFIEAKAAIDTGRKPATLADDRIRLSTLCEWIAPLLGVTSLAGLVSKLVAPPLAGAGVIFAAVSGADTLSEKVENVLENASFKAKLPALKSVYEREAGMRSRELQQPLAV